MDRIFAWCQRAADRLAVRPGLHAHGPGASHRGARSGRLSGSVAALSPLLRPARRPRLDAMSRRPAPPTSRRPTSPSTRWLTTRAGRRAGGGRVLGRHRQHGGAAAGAARATRRSGGSPDRIRAFTLDLGGGRDAAQAERVVRDARARGAVGADRRVARETYDLEARDSRSSRTTTRSTSSARRRRCACCAAFASDTRVCATCSTATAATRTSSRIRSRTRT